MNKISHMSFYILCLLYVFLVFLVMNFKDMYYTLDFEDGPVELLGALALLITSIILWTTAVKRKKQIKNKDYKFWAYIGAGVLFFWAAGEEISWGQHMLGTTTPDWLKAVNDQNETNLHNINKKFFDRWLERMTFLLAVTTSILHLRGKDRLFGFKMPLNSLCLAFLLLPIYRKLGDWNQDVWPIGYLFFIIYPFLAIRNKNKTLALQCFCFCLTTFIVWYFHHHNWHHLFGDGGNILHEIRETCFALLCIAFSSCLYLDENQNIKT